MDMWADHETRWPKTRQHAADLPTDAPTSSHRNGGLRPSPEPQAETAEAIAAALLASLRAYPLLTGASGDGAADLPAIEYTLLRLSALVEDLPAVVEISIDPLVIGRPGEGVAAVSPAVRLGPL
jgi:ATP-grasp domain